MRQGNEMESDDKFWLGTWAILGAVIAMLIVSCSVANVEISAKYYPLLHASIDKCIGEHGTWVRQGTSDGECVFGGR